MDGIHDTNSQYGSHEPRRAVRCVPHPAASAQPFQWIARNSGTMMMTVTGKPDVNRLSRLGLTLSNGLSSNHQARAARLITLVTTSGTVSHLPYALLN
jgi:hypothetical protein